MTEMRPASWMGERVVTLLAALAVVTIGTIVLPSAVQAQGTSAVIMQDATGGLFVPGLGENVRVLQAALTNFTTPAPFDNGGSGMTVTKIAPGVWDIDTIFPATGARPTVVCSARDFNGARSCSYVLSVPGPFWRVTLRTRNSADAMVDTDVSVVMIGNR